MILGIELTEKSKNLARWGLSEEDLPSHLAEFSDTRVCLFDNPENTLYIEIFYHLVNTEGVLSTFKTTLDISETTTPEDILDYLKQDPEYREGYKIFIDSMEISKTENNIIFVGLGKDYV